MGRPRNIYVSSRDYRPAPVPRHRTRICHLIASGLVKSQYVGLCGASTGFTEKVRMYESWRPWRAADVAHFIHNFVNMAREKSIWPSFVPFQEPIIETYEYVREEA